MIDVQCAKIHFFEEINGWRGLKFCPHAKNQSLCILELMVSTEANLNFEKLQAPKRKVDTAHVPLLQPYTKAMKNALAKDKTMATP